MVTGVCQIRMVIGGLNVYGRISIAMGSEMSEIDQQNSNAHTISKLFDILSIKMHLCIKFTTHNYVFRLDFIRTFLAIEVKTKV